MGESEGSEFEVSLPGGFGAKIKSRLISALEHLGVQKLLKRGLNDERQLALERERTNLDLRTMRELHEIALERMRSDQALQDELIADTFPSLVRKRENLAACIDHSIKELRQFGAPDLPLQDDVEDMDSDWLNFWESYAEKASTERMRELWGRLLAGEIRRPGSFGLRTLRIVSELDASTAISFQEEVKYRIQQMIVPTDRPRDPLMHLEAAGLVQAGNTPLAFALGESLAVVDGVMTMRLDSWVLEVTIRAREARSVHIPVVRLTEAGQQLAAMLPIDAPGTLRIVFNAIESNATGAVLYCTDPGESLREVLKERLQRQSDL